LHLVVAYDRHSGKRAWSALDDDAAYSSPMRVTLADLDHIIVFTATRLVGLSLDGGRVLWEHPWATDSGINPSQPLVIDGERLFVSTGYGMGAAMLAFTRDGERLGVRELWRTNRMKNQFSSSVYHDGFIYGLDEAIPGVYGCEQRRVEVERRPLRLRAGDARVRPSDCRHRRRPAGARAGDARAACRSGKRCRARRTDVESPGDVRGYLLIRNGNEMAAYDLRRDRTSRR